MTSYMYILLCGNGKYYTGSTKDLTRRLAQHQSGKGANFTRKNLPVELAYFEEFDKLSHRFYFVTTLELKVTEPVEVNVLHPTYVIPSNTN